MKNTRTFFLTITLLILCSILYAASTEKATLLNQYGLVDEAKSELIEVIFSSGNNNEQAEAYYQLGNIAFYEDNISTTLSTWKTLVEKFPNSLQAKLVMERIKLLSNTIGEVSEENLDNTIATSYISNGDFWSTGKSSKFTIDSSWIPHVEAAITWYDKVIKEFPKTAAGQKAYQKKLQTLIGWTVSGKYGTSYGIKESFYKYISQLLDTFASFEKDYPEASTLQAFRYQIAEAYWTNKDWANTRKWLNIIIQKAGNGDSFYKDTAERRLLKIEY
jgi:tetratricopeptide (TPR) repeat protein